MLLGIEESF